MNTYITYTLCTHKVYIYEKTDFADMTKLRLWKWGDYSELSGWSQCNHEGSYKCQRVAGESQCQSDVTWERLKPPLLAWKMEGGASSGGMRAASRSWRRQGNLILLRKLQKETQSRQHLGVSPETPTSAIQPPELEMIFLWSFFFFFNPLHLWSFVIVAMGNWCK